MRWCHRLGIHHAYIAGKAHDVEIEPFTGRRLQFADSRPKMKHRLAPLPVPGTPGTETNAWNALIETLHAAGLTVVSGDVCDRQFHELYAGPRDERIWRAEAPAQREVPKP